MDAGAIHTPIPAHLITKQEILRQKPPTTDKDNCPARGKEKIGNQASSPLKGNQRHLDKRESLISFLVRSKRIRVCSLTTSSPEHAKTRSGRTRTENFCCCRLSLSMVVKSGEPFTGSDGHARAAGPG